MNRVHRTIIFLGLLFCGFFPADARHIFSHLVPINQCEVRKVDLGEQKCSYQICDYQFESYSNRVMILIPNQTEVATPVRIHLHGFSQNPDGSAYNKKFDISLKNGMQTESFEKTIDAYGMWRSVCSDSPEILVVPVSYYRCDDYKKSFKTQDDLNRFIKEVEMKLAHTIQEKSLILTAHSGGGNRLSAILKEPDARISKVTIYDGLYSGSENIYNWISLSSNLEVNLLNLFTVDPVEGEPYLNSNQVIQKLKAMTYPVESTSFEDDGHHFAMDEATTPNQVQVRNIYENQYPTLDHWELVREMWNQ